MNRTNPLFCSTPARPPEREPAREELERLLQPLLARRIRLYTQGDSSLRVETAQSLLDSICFLLQMQLAEEQLPFSALLQTDPERLLDAGVECSCTVRKQATENKR